MSKNDIFNMAAITAIVFDCVKYIYALIQKSQSCASNEVKKIWQSLASLSCVSVTNKFITGTHLTERQMKQHFLTSNKYALLYSRSTIKAVILISARKISNINKQFMTLMGKKMKPVLKITLSHLPSPSIVE